MAYIHNPGLALAIVRADQRRQGDWEDLTADQIRSIEQVIDADRRGRLTQTEIVDRLHQVARTTPTHEPNTELYRIAQDES